jgi:sugar/nucleoside kinase (ribokinase family)
LRPGGSAGNTALAAYYLGAPCRLLSVLGNDSLGTWLAEQFREFNPALPVCNSATSVSVGIIHSCGERTFFTTRGHLEAFAYEHVQPFLSQASQHDSILSKGPRPLSSQRIVLLSGIVLTPKLRRGYARLLDEVAALGYQVALDTGWPSGNWNDELREETFDWLARCDHVLLNELEVVSLGDSTDFDAALVNVSRRLKPGGSLIVKRGAQGATGFQAGATTRVDAVPAAVFDTIGAGDSFNAGYLLARLEGSDLTSALEAGCRAAAAIITRFPRTSIKPGELAQLVDLPRRLIG